MKTAAQSIRPLDNGRWLDDALLALQSGGALFSCDFDDVAVRLDEALKLDINPQSLEFQLANEVKAEGQKLLPVNFFLGLGDWANWLAPIAGSRVYREARQLVFRQYRFRKTASYKHRQKLIDAGQHFTLNHVVIDNIDKLDNYYRNFKVMFESASRKGIWPRKKTDINAIRKSGQVNSARPLWAQATERDIGIAIGATGAVYRVGPGQHRTAVAKLLNLEAIPCEVRLVHVDWLIAIMTRTGLDAEAALHHGLKDIKASMQYSKA